MTDDVDVDAMLEASFKDEGGEGSKHKKSSKSHKDDERRSGKKSKKRSKSRSRSKDKDRSKSKSDKKRRSKSKDRDRSRKDREREQRDRERERGREREREYFDQQQRYRPPSPAWRSRRMPGPERRDVMPFTPRRTPPRGAKRMDEMAPEERDARTIFVMQLSARCRPRDLEDFFGSVGQVRDVRIITDSKTKRSKGIGYVEFYDTEPVPLALGLNGQRLMGAPLMIQPTQSEKNRLQNLLNPSFSATPAPAGPMKLYIGSLHFNITEEMLQSIFEPFGKIESIQLLKDPETNRSRGYGFITYENADNAKKAMEQLNEFELAGRAMKVGHVTEHTNAAARNMDTDELDRAGVDLGSTGRLQLMAKLAENTGMDLPPMALQMLQKQQTQTATNATPPIATQCFMLSNMFDPTNETSSNWEMEVQDDVIDECNKHGGIVHLFVDKASPQGNVYVKCPTIATAVNAVNSLHGRWFAGKIITANYVPVVNYHELFPDAAQANRPLLPSFQASLPPSAMPDANDRMSTGGMHRY